MVTIDFLRRMVLIGSIPTILTIYYYIISFEFKFTYSKDVTSEKKVYYFVKPTGRFKFITQK